MSTWGFHQVLSRRFTGQDSKNLGRKTSLRQRVGCKLPGDSGVHSVLGHTGGPTRESGQSFLNTLDIDLKPYKGHAVRKGSMWCGFWFHETDSISCAALTSETGSASESLTISFPALLQTCPTSSGQVSPPGPIPACPMPGMPFPLPLVCEYLWLTNCSQSYLCSVKYHAFTYFYNPRVETSFSPTGWIGSENTVTNEKGLISINPNEA